MKKMHHYWLRASCTNELFLAIIFVNTFNAAAQQKNVSGNVMDASG